MMPDHGSRAEPQRPAVLLQAPTDIDVIAGRMKLRIETADGLEGDPAERHVAAGNVFGLLTGEQNVDGSAGSMRHALGDEPVAWWGQVGAAHAGILLGPG